MSRAPLDVACPVVPAIPRQRIAALFALIAILGCASHLHPTSGAATALTSAVQIDAEVERLMQAANVPGLALSVIRHGVVVHQRGYGFADLASHRPLTPETVMYGASLTKTAFARLVLELVHEGVLDLDIPLTGQLRRPLPEYPGFEDLAADPRWKKVTPRMLLSHSSGLLNWRSINDDRRLDFKFDPGTRYVYSGEGIQVLQLIVEERTGRPLGPLMQERVFDRLGMTDTSMTWRKDFAGRESVGYTVDGAATEHSHRSRARAAGSMDTTLADETRFVVGLLADHRAHRPELAAMLTPQLPIVSPQQFPSHFGGETNVNSHIGLSAGLGVVLYRSPLGPAFFKEGNDDGTNNLVLAFPDSGDAVVFLSNSARADRIFFPLVEAQFGRTCLPWFWMGDIPWDKSELRTPAARQPPFDTCPDR